MKNKPNSDVFLDRESNQFSLIKSFAYFLLIIPVYLLLSPEIFGSITNTFAVGGDQHFILNPLLHHIHEFDKANDPLNRIWFAEFDIHHNPHFNSRYPFYFFWLGDGDGYLSYSHRAFLITHFHHIVGGLGAFVFARAIGARPVSAFAAGLFFAFCYNNTLHGPFFWRQAANAWIPWVLAGVWHVTTGKNWKTGLLIGAPTITLLIFAKSTQPLLYLAICSFFVGLAGIIYGFRNASNFKLFLKKSVFPSLALIIIALLMSSPVLLSVFLGQSEYVRWTSSGPVHGEYTVPFEATLQMPYPPKGIFNFLVPLKGLPSIGSTFVGPMVAIVLFASLKIKSVRLLTIFMIGLVFYFVINGFGKLTFIPYVTYQFPMISSVRQLTSHYLIVNVSLIVLFALGWDYFAKSTSKINALQFGIILVVAVTGVSVFVFSDLLERVSVIFAIALTLAPLLVLLIVRVNNAPRKEILLVLLAVLMVAPSSALRSERTFDATRNGLYTDDVSKNVREAWRWVATEKENAIVAARIKKYDGGRVKITSFRAASLAMYENLRPFSAGLSPRPKEDFENTNYLSRDPNRMIDRGLEFYITNDAADISNKRMALVNKIGVISIYQMTEPVQRIKPACILDKPKSNCSQSLDIASIDEGNTYFQYKVNLPVEQKLAFYGFNNGNWQVDINGDISPSIKWTKDHATFTLPPGSNDVAFKYTIPSLKTYWIYFRIGIFLYLMLFGWSIYLLSKGRIEPRFRGQNIALD